MLHYPVEKEQIVIWRPQEGPQSDLLSCPVFEIFYGGARGGGKTEGSLGDWMQHSAAHGENAIGIFVRRRLPQLTEVIARSKVLFHKLGAIYNEQKKTWTMPGGARLKFVYLERDSDAEEYQGHSYTRIYVEEVTNFPSASPINKLRATLRSGAGVPCGMRLTGNPGGPGHNWVKDRYINPAPQGYEIITEETEIEIDSVKRMVSLDRVFIPSKLTDNKLLMENDPTYSLRLQQSGSKELVRAWLDGDWSVIDGSFFSEFKEASHVVPDDCVKALPRDWLRFRSMDWGSARPFSVGWYCLIEKDLPVDGKILPRGALLKYREWYGASGINKGIKMDAADVARGIIKQEAGERIRYGVADPAIYIRNGGPSIGEIMSAERCNWRRADNKRIPGAEQVHHRLKGNAGTPMLYFAENCLDTIRTLPTLQHDEDNQEDVDTDGEDHAYDELRYAVMSRPWLPSAKLPDITPAVKALHECTFADLLEMSRASRIESEDHV